MHFWKGLVFGDYLNLSWPVHSQMFFGREFQEWKRLCQPKSKNGAVIQMTGFRSPKHNLSILINVVQRSTY